MQRDCERLVLPVLGLYSLILKKKDSQQMHEMKKYIEENKKRFFPDTYELKNEDGTVAVSPRTPPSLAPNV